MRGAILIFLFRYMYSRYSTEFLRVITHDEMFQNARIAIAQRNSSIQK